MSSWNLQPDRGKGGDDAARVLDGQARGNHCADPNQGCWARRAATSEAELAHGIPLFFDQLIEALRHSPRKSDEIDMSAAKHGDEMLRRGFTVAQVVHDYGDVCQAVTELAFELNVRSRWTNFTR